MVEQVVQLAAAETGRGRERDAREEGGPCRADVGLGGPQLQFGLTDVRATHERLGRTAGRQLLQLDPVAVRIGGDQLGRGLLTQQHGQGVVGHVTLALQRGQGGARRVDQRIRLLGIQLGGGAVAVLQLGELL